VLRTWCRERQGGPDDPLFPSPRGGHLSRGGVEELVAKHAATAARTCPSIAKKHTTPHGLRHYGDDWVMWPAGVFLLTGLPCLPIPAT
jgi:integrase/recombinase XerD